MGRQYCILCVILLAVVGAWCNIALAYSGIEDIERPKTSMSDWCFEIRDDDLIGKQYSGLVPGVILPQMNITDGNGDQVKLARGKNILIVDIGISENSLLLVEYLQKTYGAKLQIMYIIATEVPQNKISQLEERGVPVYAGCDVNTVQHYFHQTTRGYVYLVDEKRKVQSRFPPAYWLKYLNVLQAFTKGDILPAEPPAFSCLEYGMRVPDFTPMKGVEGKKYQISDFSGKPTIILFFNEKKVLELLSKVEQQYGELLNIVLIKDDEQRLAELRIAELARIGLLPRDSQKVYNDTTQGVEFDGVEKRYICLINQDDDIYLKWNVTGANSMFFLDAQLCLVDMIQFYYTYNVRNPKETNEKQLVDTLYSLTERLFLQNS